MDTLRRVEDKVDGLNIQAHTGPPSSGAPTAIHQGRQSSAQPRLRLPSQSYRDNCISDHGEIESLSVQHCLIDAPHQLPKQLTVPHMVLIWPRVYSGLVSSQASIALDLCSILHEGVSWFARKEASKHKSSLPTGDGLCAVRSIASDHALTPGPNTMLSLHPAQTREISVAYFDTFNMLFPILDRSHFMSAILDVSLREGCITEGSAGIILLLVLALGRVSIDGNSGIPISVIDGQPSGFRGGSLEEPPGLTEFNEARRRFGFLAVDCTIEYVQVMLLQSMYYESHARHIDYWRCVTSASLAVQGLQKLQSIDWKSFHGDQVKRAFWTCAIQEDFFHIDLDLPGTGINQAEAAVPLPHFHEWQGDPGELTPDESWVFHAQFLALIALRAIILRIHDTMLPSEASLSRDESLHEPSAIPIFEVCELARQLDDWQTALPQPLRWSLSDQLNVSQDGPRLHQSEDVEAPDAFLSTQELQEQTYGVLKAQLRTRFYYARSMLYRPFIYKALHAPKTMTPLDVDFCVLAICSFCAWPLSIETVKNQKRLFPHLFSWTQASVGTYIILRMTLEDSCLRSIFHERVNRKEISAAVSILRQWLQDMKQLDGTAEWACAMMDGISMDFKAEGM